MALATVSGRQAVGPTASVQQAWKTDMLAHMGRMERIWPDVKNRVGEMRADLGDVKTMGEADRWYVSYSALWRMQTPTHTYHQADDFNSYAAKATSHEQLVAVYRCDISLYVKYYRNELQTGNILATEELEHVDNRLKDMGVTGEKIYGLYELGFDAPLSVFLAREDIWASIEAKLRDWSIKPITAKPTNGNGAAVTVEPAAAPAPETSGEKEATATKTEGSITAEEATETKTEGNLAEFEDLSSLPAPVPPRPAAVAEVLRITSASRKPMADKSNSTEGTEATGPSRMQRVLSHLRRQSHPSVTRQAAAIEQKTEKAEVRSDASKPLKAAGTRRGLLRDVKEAYMLEVLFKPDVTKGMRPPFHVRFIDRVLTEAGAAREFASEKWLESRKAGREKAERKARAAETLRQNQELAKRLLGTTGTSKTTEVKEAGAEGKAPAPGK